jgi:sigma-70-like protein
VANDYSILWRTAQATTGRGGRLTLRVSLSGRPNGLWRHALVLAVEEIDTASKQAWKVSSRSNTSHLVVAGVDLGEEEDVRDVLESLVRRATETTTEILRGVDETISDIRATMRRLRAVIAEMKAAEQAQKARRRAETEAEAARHERIATKLTARFRAFDMEPAVPSSESAPPDLGESFWAQVLEALDGERPRQEEILSSEAVRAGMVEWPVSEHDPAEEAEQMLRSQALCRVLSSLPTMHRSVLERRFGLSGYDAESRERIARDMGITASRVRGIENEALAKLRSLTEAQSLRRLSL